MLAHGSGRPPRANLQMKVQLREGIASKKDVAISSKRKKKAIECLINDKSLATELIRLYSNNADLR